MSTPIYKLFIIKKLLASAAMSNEEQQKMMALSSQNLAEVGGRTVIFCWSAWASENAQWFGIEEYPDLDAVLKHTRFLQDHNWFSYLDSMTLLGTPDWPIEEFASLLKTPQPIVKLSMIKSMRAEYYTHTEEEKQKGMEVWAKIYEGCGKVILNCTSRWAAEQYRSFSFEIYPDLESCLKVHSELDKIDWFKYTETESLLGVPAT